MRFVQQGMLRSESDGSVIVLGGEEEGTSYKMITEAGIRSLYRHYREVMEL